MRPMKTAVYVTNAEHPVAAVRSVVAKYNKVITTVSQLPRSCCGHLPACHGVFPEWLGAFTQSQLSRVKVNIKHWISLSK